jgi:hypothetical protein
MLGISSKNRAMPLRRKNRPVFIIRSVVLAVNMEKNESFVNINSKVADTVAMMRPKKKLYDALI